MAPLTSIPERSVEDAPAHPVAPSSPGLWYRLRKRLRSLVRGQSPVNDGWKPAGGPVLVVAPHPDDEVIGCGGTIRRHAAAGDHTICVYLTRGEKSRGYAWFTPTQRQAKREQEARSSSHILGFKELIFLDGADGHLNERAQLSRLTYQLAGILHRTKPLVVYVPHADDNHPDHVAAFGMIRETTTEAGSVPTVYQYELWSPLTADFGVDITSEMPAKIRAIKCHDLAMDAFNYIPTMVGLAAYRSGTLLQRKGYAEAFRRLSPSAAQNE